MGLVMFEIPGDFKITIKAKDIEEAIEKLKEIEINNLLSLAGSIKDNKTWKKTKEEIENEMYCNNR